MTLAWRIRGETMTIQQALDQCLEDIRSGAASVEDCLRRYPEFANDLRPLLRMARRLESADEVRPGRAYKSRLRKQLVGEENKPKRGFFPWRMMLVGVLLGALILGALIWFGSTFEAAGGSITPLPPMTLLPSAGHLLMQLQSNICGAPFSLG